MKAWLTIAGLAWTLGAGVTQAGNFGTEADLHLVGNQSSNSSSNSSNGVHTRVDTYHSSDDRGRRYYERRIYRERVDPSPRWRRGRASDDD
jgi:Tfp pilus tip-associated adhesin PilY1